MQPPSQSALRGLPSNAAVGHGYFAWSSLFGEDIIAFGNENVLYIFSGTMMVQRLALPDTIVTFAWSPDGMLLAVGTASNGIYLCRLANQDTTPWDDEYSPWIYVLDPIPIHGAQNVSTIVWLPDESKRIMFADGAGVYMMTPQDPVSFSTSNPYVRGGGGGGGYKYSSPLSAQQQQTQQSTKYTVFTAHAIQGVTRLLVSPDSRMAAGVSSTQVFVWHVAPPPSSPTNTPSPYGSYDSESNTPVIKTAPPETNWDTYSVLNHEDVVVSCSWCPTVLNGIHSLLVTTETNEVRVWTQSSKRPNAPMYIAYMTVFTTSTFSIAQWVRPKRWVSSDSSTFTDLVRESGGYDLFEDIGAQDVSSERQHPSWILELTSNGTISLYAIRGLGAVPRAQVNLNSSSFSTYALMNHITRHGKPRRCVALTEASLQDGKPPTTVLFYVSFEDDSISLFSYSPNTEPCTLNLLTFTGHGSPLSTLNLHPVLPLATTVANNEVICWHIQPAHAMSSVHFGEPTTAPFFRLATFNAPRVLIVESSPPQDVKSRLTRYLTRYSPDKLPLVDKLLLPFKGKEEDVFKALIPKYGPEVPAESVRTEVPVDVRCVAWHDHTMYLGTTGGSIICVRMKADFTLLRGAESAAFNLDRSLIAHAGLYTLVQESILELSASSILSLVTTRNGVVVAISCDGKVATVMDRAVTWSGNMNLPAAAFPLKRTSLCLQGEWEAEGVKHIATVVSYDALGQLHSTLMVEKREKETDTKATMSLQTLGKGIQVPIQATFLESACGTWCAVASETEVQIYGLALHGDWELEGRIHVTTGYIASMSLSGEEGSHNGLTSHAWLTVVSSTGKVVIFTSIRSDRTPQDIEPFVHEISSFGRWAVLFTTHLQQDVPQICNSYFLPRCARLATYAGACTCVLLPLRGTSLASIPITIYWKRVPSYALADCHPTALFGLMLDGRYKALETVMRETENAMERFASLPVESVTPLQRISHTHTRGGKKLFSKTPSVPVSLMPTSLPALMSERVQHGAGTWTVDLKKFMELINQHPLPGMTRHDQMTLNCTIDILDKIQSGSVALDPPSSRFYAHYQMRQQRKSQGTPANVVPLKYSHLAWAAHSETQDQLLSMLSTKDMNWAEAKALGIPFWMKPTSLKAAAELIGKAQFTASDPKEPRTAALWYIASGKRTAFMALCKACRQEKLAEFFARDFTDEKNKSTAIRSAYNAMSTGNVEFAVAFFLMAESYDDAVLCIMQRINDWQLAFCVLRLALGDKHPTTIAFAENKLKELRPHMREEAWERHLLYWFLGHVGNALTVVASESCRNDPSAYPLLTHIMASNPKLVPFVKTHFSSTVQAHLSLLMARYFIRNGTYSLGIQYLLEHLKKFSEKDDGMAKKRAETAAAIQSGTMDFSTMFGMSGFGGDATTTQNTNSDQSTNMSNLVMPDPAEHTVDRTVVLGIMFQALLDFLFSRIHVVYVLCKSQSRKTPEEWFTIIDSMRNSVQFMVKNFPFSEETLLRAVEAQCSEHKLAIGHILLVPNSKDVTIMAAARLGILFRDQLPVCITENYPAMYDVWYQCQELLHLTDLMHVMGKPPTMETYEATQALRSGLATIATKGRLSSLTTVLYEATSDDHTHDEFKLWGYYLDVFRKKEEVDTLVLEEWKEQEPSSSLFVREKTSMHMLNTLCYIYSAAVARRIEMTVSSLSPPVGAVTLLLELFGMRNKHAALSKTCAIEYNTTAEKLGPWIGNNLSESASLIASLLISVITQEDTDTLKEVVIDVTSIVRQLDTPRAQPILPHVSKECVKDSVHYPWSEEWESQESLHYNSHVNLNKLYQRVSKERALVEDLHYQWKLGNTAPMEVRRHTMLDFIQHGHAFNQSVEYYKNPKALAYAVCIDQSSNDIIAIATQKGVREVCISGSLGGRRRTQDGRSVLDEDDGSWEDTWERYRSGGEMINSFNPDTGFVMVRRQDGSPNALGGSGLPLVASFNDVSAASALSPSIDEFQQQGDGVDHELRARCLASHPTLPLYLTGGVDGVVQMYKFGTPRSLRSYKTEHSKYKISRVRFSAKGHLFCAGDQVGRFTAWRVESQSTNDTTPYASIKCFDDVITDMTDLTTSTLFGITCGKDIKLFDMLSDSIVSHIPVTDDVTSSCTYHGLTQTVLIGTRRGEIAVFDLRRCSVVYTHKGCHTGSIRSMSIDPTSNILATGSTEGDIRLWDLQSLVRGTPETQSTTSQESCIPMMLSAFPDVHPKTKFFALESTIPMSTYGVTCVEFTPSGTLLSCGSDGRVLAFPTSDQHTA